MREINDVLKGEDMTKLFNRPEYKELRRDLRNNPTNTEKLLWNILKGKKLGGFKFRRQHGVGKYILDFYCAPEKFAVEIDEEVNDTLESKIHDSDRDVFLKSIGIRTFRIRSEEIEINIDVVAEMILKKIYDCNQPPAHF